MIKKLMAVAMAGASIMSFAGFIMADDEFRVTNHGLDVSTSTSAYGTSGRNRMSVRASKGGEVEDVELYTGDVVVSATSLVDVATTLATIDDHSDFDDVSISNSHSDVRTRTTASGTSGMNRMRVRATKGGEAEDIKTSTGDVTSVGDSEVSVGYTEVTID